MSKRLLQINVTANRGSTGKIAEQIGKLAIGRGWESYIAFGRGAPHSESDLIRIGNNMDMRVHAMQTRLLDNHGLASVYATKQFVKQIQRIKPNIVHLHNIHGYYLNYPVLFEYLKAWGGPVVWTLHDCWPFTGHCAYFMMSGCEKWKTGCYACDSLRSYPASILKDNSRHNFMRKMASFTSLGDRLTMVPVSYYVGDYLNESFFKGTNVRVIHNGIDTDVFRPCAAKDKMILGVANVWEPRKGLHDFYKLRELMPWDFRILLVGLNETQLKSLPDGIEGLSRTNGQHELARLYSSAMVLVNPTYEDNYPTVNLEAISCGTPVITYNTGGSPESITAETGIVVDQGDVNGIADGIMSIDEGKFSVEKCRKYAEMNFKQSDCFEAYFDLYSEILE